jgi:prevent-host-death family protein
VKTIAAAKFKEQCLGLIDRLGRDGLVITKHGKPVARVLPIAREPGDLIGALRGRITVHGDILTTGTVWDVGD